MREGNEGKEEESNSRGRNLSLSDICVGLPRGFGKRERRGRVEWGGRRCFFNLFIELMRCIVGFAGSF